MKSLAKNLSVGRNELLRWKKRMRHFDDLKELLLWRSDQTTKNECWFFNKWSDDSRNGERSCKFDLYVAGTVWHSLTFEFLLYFSLYSSDFLLEGNEHSLVVEITFLSRWNSYLIAVKISACKVNDLACAWLSRNTLCMTGLRTFLLQLVWGSQLRSANCLDKEIWVRWLNVPRRPISSR